MRGETRTASKSRRDQQRVETPPDIGVPAGAALQLHLTGNGGARRRAFGVEEGRAMVALDHGHRPAGAQQRTQCDERACGVGQVLQDEAKNDVIKRGRREGKGPQVRLPECDVAHPLGRDPRRGLGE